MKYCSECPYVKVMPVYWNPEFEEDDQDIYCSKLNRLVHMKLHSDEIATRNHKHQGKDIPPGDCPLKNPEQ